MQELDEKKFNEVVLNGQGLVLVDFWAEWCGPCKMLLPVLDKLEAEMTSGVTFTKVNTEHSPEVAANYGVRMLPTLVLFKDGEVVDTMMGVHTKDKLKAWLESHIS